MCNHATFDSSGELRIAQVVNGTYTGVGFVARSTGGGDNGGQFIGTIRYLNSTVSTTDQGYLECYSSLNTTCNAPSDANDMPEAVPEYLQLNVVSQQDDDNASYPAGSGYSPGSAKTQIAGGTSITGATQFEVVGMDPNTCAQTLLGPVHNQVFASYEWNANFGGTVGTVGALVIEEVEYEADGVTPNHIERYYFVNGYGEVRSSTGFWNASTKQYQSGLNENLNTLYPVSQVMPPEPPSTCPQGTNSYTYSN